MQFYTTMKTRKHILGIFLLGLILYSCNWTSTKNIVDPKEKEEAVVIANDSLEYEVIIFDIGFNQYLNTVARPMGFYSQNYLENWNNIYITNWNIRVQNPTRYDPNLYANLIDWDPLIDYGMEVNYKLFNYFQFAQLKYNIRLDSEVNTIVRPR